MSQGNVEIVRRGAEAAVRRPKPDWATMNELFHPDHEFISRYDTLEGGSRRGARGYRDWLLNNEETVQSEVSVETVTEIDADRVLMMATTRLSGKASGIRLDDQQLAAIMTVRDGQIIRTEAYSSSDEALKAAGLPG